MNKKNIAVVIFLSLSLFWAGCRKDHHDHDDDQHTCENIALVKVAALVSETGDWSNLGLSSEAAIEIAIEEINADFESRDLPYRFELTVFDTQLNPVLAASSMQNLADAGFKIVIGPQSSAEVGAVKALADSLGILVVSQGSTASSLAIADDFVFRYVPGDQIEGAAMANTMYTSGKQAIVTLARNDAGNLGLQNAVTTFFTNAGGIAVSAGNYDPTATDFSATLTAVRNEIQNFNATYPLTSIGVYLASFDEAVALFNQAATDPVLASVHWYGGDGFIRNEALLADPLASQFAVNTQFFSPEFGLPSSSETTWAPLLADVYARSGVVGDAYTLTAYDAMKVIAKMIENNQGIPTSNSTFKTEFFNLSNNHSGATGVISLNAAGDRSNGSFDYWGVEVINGVYGWVYVGSSE
ncbi:MAG: ABC transporter substrate-binding protein [Bacteroidota bacterium]|jgi:branched-chain amino acid transport system substrate-binding protein